MATASFINFGKSTVEKRIYSSIDDALSIRNAVFHENEYRRGEARFEVVKIFDRQISREELELKFLQILQDYGNEPATRNALLKGVRSHKHNILAESSKCISCSCTWQTHTHFENLKWSIRPEDYSMMLNRCAYFKFLITNRVNIKSYF